MPIYAEIEAISRKFSGKLGLWAHSLDTGETIAVHADEPFPSASTIKLPLLYELYRQVGEGKVRLTDPLTVAADDIVPGSGVLKDLGAGVTLTVRQMAVLMIIVSDNTATNILADLVGKENVDASMAALGLTNTHLYNKLFKAPPGAPSNCASPADLGKLMLMIAEGKVLNPEACADMLQILGQQHLTEGITRRIPDFDAFVEAGKEPLATVASKSGAIRGTRNDVGFVKARGRRYVISMMTKECTDPRFYPDNEGLLFLADISALIYRRFVTEA